MVTHTGKVEPAAVVLLVAVVGIAVDVQSVVELIAESADDAVLEYGIADEFELQLN